MITVKVNKEAKRYVFLTEERNARIVEICRETYLSEQLPKDIQDDVEYVFLHYYGNIDPIQRLLERYTDWSYSFEFREKFNILEEHRKMIVRVNKIKNILGE